MIFAAVWAGYTWTDFVRLDSSIQADLIAAYEIKHKIEAIASEEAARRARQKSRRR